MYSSEAHDDPLEATIFGRLVQSGLGLQQCYAPLQRSTRINLNDICFSYEMSYMLVNVVKRFEWKGVPP